MSILQIWFKTTPQNSRCSVNHKQGNFKEQYNILKHIMIKYPETEDQDQNQHKEKDILYTGKQ